MVFFIDYLIRFRFNLPILKPPFLSHANSQSPGITAYLLIKYINISMCQSSCMNSGKKKQLTGVSAWVSVYLCHM